MGKSKFFCVLALCCLFTIAVGAGCFFLGKKVTDSDSVPQYLLTQDVPRGHSIAGKFEEVLVPSNSSVSSDNLIISQSQLEDAVAAVDLYKHSPLTKSSLTTIENIQRNLVKTVPVTVETSIANSIEAGDHVALILKYNNTTAVTSGKEVSVDEKNKNSAVVISDLTIDQLKSTAGEVISEAGTTPGFAVFAVTPSELNDIDTATAEGTLYLVKYENLDQPRLVKNYVKGEATPKVPTDGTETGTQVPTPTTPEQPASPDKK